MIRYDTVNRLERPALWVADRALAGRVGPEAPWRAVGRQMRLRQTYPRKIQAVADGPYAQLRLLTAASDQQAGLQAWAKQQWWTCHRDEAVPHLVENEAALLLSGGHKLREIRRARHSRLRGMVWQLRRFSRLGDGEWLSGASYDRQDRQRRPVFAGELPMGNVQRASRQQEAAPCKGGLI